MSYVPEISIVLSSYNRKIYLSKAIESCLIQTFKNFELIIVDDCSSDASVSVAEFYAAKDHRIKIIRNENNKKLPATLNIGFREARGEYLTWTSDDNIMAPNALEIMKYYLDMMPEVGLVYTDYILIDANGKIGKHIYQEEPEFLPIRSCVGACFLYRAKVAAKAGLYNEEIFLNEDYEYWLRLGLITKLYHIKEAPYFYRIHSSSLTSTRKEEIRQGKLLLKKQFADKYSVSKDYQPIANLYNWFIGDKNFKSYITLCKIVLSNPIITISYILRNLRRL